MRVILKTKRANKKLVNGDSDVHSVLQKKKNTVLTKRYVNINQSFCARLCENGTGFLSPEWHF